GFKRVKINGEFSEIADAPKLDKKYKHDIDVVVDRIVVRKDVGTRLADSFETALELADGIAIAEFADRPLAAAAKSSARGKASDAAAAAAEPGKSRAATRTTDGELEREEGVLRNKTETHERIVFSARFACPVSGFSIDEIDPRLFSFNAPAGACPKCDGLGTELRFEPELVVPDPSLSLKAGEGYTRGQTRHNPPYPQQTQAAHPRHFQGSEA